MPYERMPYKRFRIYPDQLTKFLEFREFREFENSIDHSDFEKNGGIVFGRLGDEFYFRPHKPELLTAFKVGEMEELKGGSPLLDYLQEGDAKYDELLKHLEEKPKRPLSLDQQIALGKEFKKRPLSLDEQIALGKEFKVRSGALLVVPNPHARGISVANKLLEAFRSLTEALKTWKGGFAQISAIYIEKEESKSRIKIQIDDGVDVDSLYDHFCSVINTRLFQNMYYKLEVSGILKIASEDYTCLNDPRISKNHYLSDPNAKKNICTQIESIWR